MWFAPLHWESPGLSVSLLLGPVVGVALFLALERSPRLRLGQIRELSGEALTYRSLFMLLKSSAEEVVWRGVLLEALQVYLPGLLAAVATAILFGVYHWPHTEGRGAAMHALTGLVFCATYQTTGTLVHSVLAHITYNLFLVGRTSKPRSA